MSRRVKPLKPKAQKPQTNARLYLYSAGGLVVALAIGFFVATTVGQNPAAVTKAPTPPSAAAVSQPTKTPTGWHEPVQKPLATTPKAVAAFHYNTDPPTSGPSVATWPKAFVASSPLAKGVLVHALDEGDVVVAYGPNTSAGTLKNLDAFAKSVDTQGVGVTKRLQAGEGVLVTPWPSLKAGQVDLLAWTRLEAMTGWQAPEAETFVGDFLGNTANLAQ